MPGTFIRGLAADLRVCVIFFTRLPLPFGDPIAATDLTRALWAAPLIGSFIGAIGAFCYWAAHWIGVPVMPSCMLALAATMALTGALHEDGLADTIDGFGGGATRERKLEIMRDSRIGTFGVCALITCVVARVGALASLLEPALVASALIAAHAAARAAIPAFMWLVPPARSNGLSAGAGQPPPWAVLVAAFVGVLALGIGLGIGPGVFALVLLLLVMTAMARLARQQIGGQTGDVVGATEQVIETLIVLVAATFL